MSAGTADPTFFIAKVIIVYSVMLVLCQFVIHDLFYHNFIVIEVGMLKSPYSFTASVRYLGLHKGECRCLLINKNL